MPTLTTGAGTYRAIVAGSTAYVTGDRTASISVSASATLMSGSAGPVTNLVNGSFALNSSGSTYFAPSATTDILVNPAIYFDFGTNKIVDEAKWYQDTADTNGGWKWQGTTDAAGATGYVDVGTTFTLGGATPFQTHTQLNGNTTAYRWYRLIRQSGSTNDAEFLEEIEFKQN